MDNLNKKINNCFISVNIQKDDFDVNAEIQSIGSRKIIGGIANFIGVVRDSQKEKEELVSLELEHYPVILLHNELPFYIRVCQWRSPR